MYISNPKQSRFQNQIEGPHDGSHGYSRSYVGSCEGAVDDLAIHGIGQDRTLIDIDHVVRMNRQYAESLGWEEYRGRIAALLGLQAKSDEKDFAEAVASWQRRKKILRTGIINHETWFHLQVALGLLDPPFPRARLDDAHLTDLIFNSNHPERKLAPIKESEVALKEEWKQIRKTIVSPALQQSPMCDVTGPDLERLADNIRWLNAELRMRTPDPKRLVRLKNLLSLQVKIILQSLDPYINAGCSEPNLEILRLMMQALPWPKDIAVQAERTKLISGVEEAQKKALKSSDTWHKKCSALGIIRIEVRKPKDLSKSFTKDAVQAALASSAVQIFVPKTATDVSQLEWAHARLEWVCPQARTSNGRVGGERGIHTILWTVRAGQSGICPLDIVGTQRLACDGHTYGLAVKPGSSLREAAEKKGFDMNKCEWEFVETFRATTSAYNGLIPLGRCIWGFQFTAKQSIAGGKITKNASVTYWGVDKELISP
jgi:hypothetical protein